MQPTSTTRNSAVSADDTRTIILNAALDVFSREGAAGARTEEIARVAGVNKALLYYYFKDKDALLGAVIEHAMAEAFPRFMAAIDAAKTPREQLLAYINQHFDRIAAKPHISRLIQYEILRAAEGGAGHMPLIAERFNLPLLHRIQKIIEDGIRSGDFVQIDARQAALSIVSIVVFYFMTAPVFRLVTGFDPYAPASLAKRKAAVIDFVSHALFTPEPNEKAKKKNQKGKSGERKK
jgi:TetR/AcrR family transcriptional regulator